MQSSTLTLLPPPLAPCVFRVLPPHLHQPSEFVKMEPLRRVRERDESSYAICLSHDCRVKHYRIDILPTGTFAIQDGPKFESIIAVSGTIFFSLSWLHFEADIN